MQIALQTSNYSLEQWHTRTRQPIDPTYTNKISMKGNPEGPLFGEHLVFTGALQLKRKEAATLAAKAGCTVSSNVSNKTSLLVIGDQDLSRLAGQDKSSKHRKAEELIKTGNDIKILSESDFLHLIATYA
jgi:DNA polymerase-3 subunit epsilon